MIAMGLAALGLIVQAGIVAVVAIRLRRRDHLPAGDVPPKVSLVRPVRGIDYRSEDTLATSFALEHRPIEILFCVEDEDDPIVPIVRRLIAAHPDADARLLIGRDPVSANPKLNNIIKGWRAASADWIILSDSNALLPANYVATLRARWRPDIGVVSHAALASDPRSFAAEIECAILNSHQAKIALAADSIGIGFALGKTLMWQRAFLDRLGGPAILGNEAAEDIAATNLLRGSGFRPRLALRPLPQPLGPRRFRDVWARQVRWARLRRVGLRSVYAVELLSGAVVPVGSMAGLAAAGAVGWAWVAAYVVAWYGGEAVMSLAGGWPHSWRMPFAAIVRDLLLPVIWLAGLGRSFEWRGVRMSVGPDRRAGPD